MRHILVLRKGVVQIEHLMKMYKTNTIQFGVWKSDVFVKDKQNVDAALTILQDVQICMREWRDKETVATRKWDSVVYRVMPSVILVSKRGLNLRGLQLYS